MFSDLLPYLTVSYTSFFWSDFFVFPLEIGKMYASNPLENVGITEKEFARKK